MPLAVDRVEKKDVCGHDQRELSGGSSTYCLMTGIVGLVVTPRPSPQVIF